ncbi:hypothetical protein B0J12DRAFT_701665 [Macrophomina phaseolina]|uniref:Uncharacterized protein n=1 Tax=Macrophomina phaseolina TaxID=35725 RepID=A0ABQ8G3R9_9PEZI|nr:hypothetical protein B0J12DRAFT_701665 [Macrophomina phaseolina]
MAPSPAVIMPGRMLPPPPPAPPHAAQQPKPDQPASGDENNTTTAAKGNGDRKGSDPTSSKPTSDVPIRIEATATDPALESGAPPGSPRGDTALAPLSTRIKHYTGLSTRVLQDPRGPTHSIPTLVSYYTIPSAAELDVLEVQLRRRAAFDVYQVATALAKTLQEAVGQAEERVRACHRAESYSEEEQDLEGQLAADTRACEEVMEALQQVVRGALEGGKRAGEEGKVRVLEELRWFDWVGGRGKKRTREGHRKEVEAAYIEWVEWQWDGRPHGLGMRYLVTVCREFQGLLAAKELEWVVGAVRKLGWGVLGKEVIWDEQEWLHARCGRGVCKALDENIQCQDDGDEEEEEEKTKRKATDALDLQGADLDGPDAGGWNGFCEGHPAHAGKGIA